MIELRQNDRGCTVINFSKEKDFNTSIDKFELTSSLYIREFRPHEIVAENSGQPGALLHYVWHFLTSKGYAVNLDNASTRLLRVFEDEKKLVAVIRSSKTKAVSLEKASDIGLARPLLEHQRKAVQHALSVQHAANFSVPGSGKTTTALSVYASLKHRGIVERLLVIGPASSFAPWEDEFRLTLGKEPVVARLTGTKAQREKVLRHLDNVDVVLCTYQMAHRERENLSRILKQAKYFLILDESHHIKNINLGPWAQTAVELAPLAERRMILSGTPVPHSLQDLWTQFTFLWPSQAVLGTRSNFEQRLQDERNASTNLRKSLAPFFFRTKKSDLGLPEPVSHFTKIEEPEIPKFQRLIIGLLELKTLQEARDLGLGQSDVSLLRRWRRARAIRLLQAASNPALLATELPELGDMGEPLDRDPSLSSLLANYLAKETPAKIRFVVEKARQLASEGRKVLIWATFVDNLLLLKNLLADLSPLLIYGDVPAYEEETKPEQENRERNIYEFKNDPDRRILLANPAACSESISLHMVCSDAVYLERTFNCGQFLQSLDRIHRVGMPSGVRPNYHIPLLECAIEQVVDRRLKKRQSVLYKLLDDDMPVLGYDDESFLVEREDDLESILEEVLQQISSKTDERSKKAPPRRRTRR